MLIAHIFFLDNTWFQLATLSNRRGLFIQVFTVKYIILLEYNYIDGPNSFTII